MIFLKDYMQYKYIYIYEECINTYNLVYTKLKISEKQKLTLYFFSNQPSVAEQSWQEDAAQQALQPCAADEIPAGNVGQHHNRGLARD